VEIPIQIPNGTNQVIIQVGDPNTVWLVVATLIIAGVTFFGILLSNKRTRESIELSEKELKSRMIPLLQFENTNANLTTHKEQRIVRLTAVLRNAGIVPARKIIYRAFESNNTKINDIVKEGDKIKNSHMEIGTIQQGGSRDFLNDIAWNPPDRAYTNWIVWFEYSYLDVPKEKIVVVFENITGGLHPVPHKWYVHDDVIEAEKRRDDERAGKISAPT